ncbi:MAG: polysaccharide deacetylase family protein [Spirochaetales bacterium]
MHKSFLSFFPIVVLLLCSTPGSATGKVLILDYHTFLGKGNSSMDYSLAELGDQLDQMRQAGWQLVSLDEALAGHLTGDKNVAITIDDGHQSVFAAVENVLLPREVPAELFIFPGPLDRSPHYLKVSRLKKLLADGYSMGAHGYNHLYMTASAWKRDPQAVLREAGKPADVLKRMTGRLPSLFAYPFGVAAPEAEEAVKAAGYQWAFLATGKLVLVDPSNPALDHWAVPRTIVYRSGLKALFRFLRSQP